MLEAGRASALHAPVAARVKTVNVHDGEIVAQGEVLIELESPDLDSRQAIVRREIQIQQLQMRRQASRSETAADAGIVEQRLAEAVAEYRGLAAQRERLLLRSAPRRQGARSVAAVDGRPLVIDQRSFGAGGRRRRAVARLSGRSRTLACRPGRQRTLHRR